ncbi:hypothetical protein EGT49_07935 [Companilactobacillus suantsaicola]|uniref:Uncharacterized protein n=1 Tax=Companilactobacillus suantsaicola TaxID=2487723 RepID=A0A4Z0JLD3_9LACO|nr:hypothetical protein [Companilactobacillus suantsaicola]TGD22843.1 hypothetical protein EGT49_07935 [Companilactobacillus suantsaicola]
MFKKIKIKPLMGGITVIIILLGFFLVLISNLHPTVKLIPNYDSILVCERVGIYLLIMGTIVFVIRFVLELCIRITGYLIDIYYKLKRKRNLNFLKSISSEEGRKPDYFFNRLNELIDENREDVFIKSLEFYKHRERHINGLKLKKSIYEDKGGYDIRAVFERNELFLRILQYMSLDELNEWKIFLSVDEAPHSIKSLVRNLILSSSIVTVISFVIKSILDFPTLIYVLSWILLIFFSVLILYIGHAWREKYLKISSTMIERAIEIKEDQIVRRKSTLRHKARY